MPHPRFEADRCVHSLLAAATCTSCIDVCPRQALQLGEDALQLDLEACDGCGLCGPACSERAIDIDLPAAARRERPDGLAAFAACDVVVKPGGEGVLPCLHALGPRELDGLAAEGVACLVVTSGDCTSCPRGTAPTLSDTARDVSRLRRSKGLAGLEIARLAPTEWLSALARAGRRHGPVDAGRRSLLGLGRVQAATRRTVPEVETAELHAVAPFLDEALCTGCDACVRVCPHEALLLVEEEQSRAYESDPGSCTGCGLCRDVCPTQAVTLERLSEGRLRVALTTARCRSCGVDFHVPGGRPPTDLCPICTGRGSTRALFLVKDRRGPVV